MHCGGHEELGLEGLVEERGHLPDAVGVCTGAEGGGGEDDSVA